MYRKQPTLQQLTFWKSAAFSLAGILLLVLGVRMAVASSVSTVNNLEITPLSGNWSKPDKYVLKNISQEPLQVRWELDCWTEWEGSACEDQRGTQTIAPNATYEVGLGLICAKWQLNIQWNQSRWKGVVEEVCASGTPSPTGSITITPTSVPTVTTTVAPTPTTALTPSPTAARQFVTVQKRVRIKGESNWNEKIEGINAGREVEFEIAVKNTGESELSNVRLLDTLPDNLEWLEGSLDKTLPTLASGQEHKYTIFTKTNTKGVANDTQKCVDNTVSVLMNNDKYASDIATVCLVYKAGQVLGEENNLPETAGLEGWGLIVGITLLLGAAGGLQYASVRIERNAKTAPWRR